MACLGRYTFLVVTSVILSDGVKMRVEHGMLRHTTRIRAQALDIAIFIHTVQLVVRIRRICRNHVRHILRMPVRG